MQATGHSSAASSTASPNADTTDKVGSVGTRAFIVLLQGRDEDDPLFLQVKEATASVLEDHLAKSRYAQPGERVVQGQRLMQGALMDTPNLLLIMTDEDEERYPP